jgi:hypothetical protein
MTTNWKAMQVAGALKAKGSMPRPSEVLPRYMAGGSWHADLHKEGKRHQRSSGGGKQP